MIAEFIDRTGTRTVILAGAVGSASQKNESVVERALQGKAEIVSAFDIVPSQTPWPYVVGDGRAMPYRANAADMVISNAVIEHVGQEHDQRQFIAEHVRVAPHWVVTTPNRWFPVESHTTTLFRHWSRRWSADRDEFTRLLSRRELGRLLPDGSRIVGRPWSATFTAFSS